MTDFYKINAKGVLFESLTSDPTSPEEGEKYYNVTSHKFRQYTNGVWQDERPTSTSGPSTSDAVCSTSVVAGQAVAMIAGGLVPADTTNSAHAGAVIGVALTSGTAGQTVQVVSSGLLNLTPSFVAGDKYFIGTTPGTLQAAPPGSGWLQQMGVADSTGRLVVSIGQVIVR